MGYIKSPLDFFIERFSQTPNNVSKEQYRYFALASYFSYIYIVALVAHFGLLISFAVLGVNNLAFFNIGSCVAFVIVILTNLRGYLRLGSAIAVLEVLIHAIVCVYTLGWSPGFQYYLFSLIAGIFISPLSKLSSKIAQTALISLIYILLNYYSQNNTPIMVLSPIVINIFTIVNILICIASISLSIFISDRATAKAESQLIDAMQELKKAQLETERKNQELNSKNEELIESYKRANLLFSALSEALPGTVLEGKYQLDEKIGVGGFSAVFRAIHLVTKRAVAVKVFQPIGSNATATGLERFQLEAILACRVNHHNAIEVLDSGLSGGIAYITMELLNGHTLSQELKQINYMSVKRCAEIIIPVCDVLAKAHEVGIIHRDIKPDNIFLHYFEGEEIIKVVDFGIAKLQGEIEGVGKQNLTGDGGLLGTPTYMSPERLMSNICDAPSDIYSIGIMIYQMLCGRLPFQSNDMWQIIHMHLTSIPPPMANSGISSEIEAIVMQALSKDPNERPSARVLAEEFAKLTNFELKAKNKDNKGSTKILSAESMSDKLNVADDPTLDVTRNF
ncbi:MAG: serine/threonine protein kinase [Blastocatellia bacterium]|nr:serine/threonine protein kinase [Blastocatellia bacterium]